MKKLITIIVAVCFMFVSVGPCLAQSGMAGEQKSTQAPPGTKPPKLDKHGNPVDVGGHAIDNKTCRNPQGVIIPCPNENSSKAGEKVKPSHPSQKPPVQQKATGKPVPK